MIYEIISAMDLDLEGLQTEYGEELKEFDTFASEGNLLINIKSLCELTRLKEAIGHELILTDIKKIHGFLGVEGDEQIIKIYDDYIE